MAWERWYQRWAGQPLVRALSRDKPAGHHRAFKTPKSKTDARLFKSNSVKRAPIANPRPGLNSEGASSLTGFSSRNGPCEFSGRLGVDDPPLPPEAPKTTSDRFGPLGRLREGLQPSVIPEFRLDPFTGRGSAALETLLSLRGL